jgi:DNA-directed RNA polymerase sigma subunit (sigma70/sigma32)
VLLSLIARSPLRSLTHHSLLLLPYVSMEPTPEDVVERSLLRQCLENALAIELSPHERDVLRLRHGLDDGVSRTVKEVLESCGGTLTPKDIRRAEYRAYSKLRIPQSIHNKRLRGFADEFSLIEESQEFAGTTKRH